MRHYPIFLDLRERPVLVAGAGKIALRKTKGLLEAGARVTVVAPEWDDEFESLPVRLVRRKFRTSDLQSAALVFAATDDRATNRRIGNAARKKGVFANIADRAAECDFVVPARVQRGRLQIAVSTGGQNPKLAVELRKKLETILCSMPQSSRCLSYPLRGSSRHSPSSVMVPTMGRRTAETGRLNQ